ncbi:hypothetical protein FHS90_004322 [Rufibacter quisquiliarum]|uniref:Uncharacterized protein n=1 Tax=Rufibacter quisquiliarum TaxID=1549639 RepID=A0A839GIX5_9BACT|nr:hypothetical protein [Rufibacter quisquiliarum]
MISEIKPLLNNRFLKKDKENLAKCEKNGVTYEKECPKG